MGEFRNDNKTALQSKAESPRTGYKNTHFCSWDLDLNVRWPWHMNMT